MSLTAEQQKTIDQLTSAFAEINAASVKSEGIIGISEIIDTEKSRKQRKKEIELIQLSHDKARKEQVVKDLEKIKNEIELLGLKVELHYDSSIKISREGDNSWNHIYIHYKYQWNTTYRNEHELENSQEFKVYHSFQLIMNEDDKYYGCSKFDTIEDFVLFDNFRQRLAYLHRSINNK